MVLQVSQALAHWYQKFVTHFGCYINNVDSAELDFDKSNEILFRLGIIYKQQCKYEESLACFDRILRSPPSPLAHADIWFQIGHVYEQQKDVSIPLAFSCLCFVLNITHSTFELKMHISIS